MKILLTTFLLAFSLVGSAQTTITLTEDLVLSETLTITEDVTYQGNNFKIICNGCAPAISVENGARVHFQDVFFPKVYTKWLRVKDGNMSDVTWNSAVMRGRISVNE